MINKIIIAVLITLIAGKVVADDFDTDLVQVKYEQKSARKAMLLSALLPGAGQFYANRSSITTYIFPAIEIGLWVGYFTYNKKGNDKEDEYIDFANEYYDRDRQTQCQEDLQAATDNPFYDDHFHLDNDNSQHFYEDIGKYEQYIFGWADWYDIYAIDEDSNFGPDWLFETGDNSEPDWRWVGNAVTNPESEYYLGNESLYNQNQGIYSGFRAEYIAMRQDAEDYFNTANMLGFGIVFNHILASLDALRVTRKYNLEYISQNNLRIKFTPVFINNELSAGVMISKDF